MLHVSKLLTLDGSCFIFSELLETVVYTIIQNTDEASESVPKITNNISLLLDLTGNKYLYPGFRGKQ